MVTHHNPMTPSQGTLGQYIFHCHKWGDVLLVSSKFRQECCNLYWTGIKPSIATTALNVMVPKMKNSVIQGTILLNYWSNKALHYRINSPRWIKIFYHWHTITSTNAATIISFWHTSTENTLPDYVTYSTHFSIFKAFIQVH